MKNDLVSIIVPVYNVEKYVSKCIDSLLKQTYKNIEIVLVNDGSKDNSYKICEELSKKDNRIHLYTKENGGLSSARNFGIKKASGKFITFVDSDDYISDTFVETLYVNLVDTNADISCCGYQMIYDNKIIYINNGNEIKIYDKITALEKLYLTNDIGMIFCNKLFKKELFENILFPIGQCFEDINTIYKIIDKSNIIVYNPECKYYYIQRSDSINGKNFKNKKFNVSIYDLYNANMEVYSFLNKNYPDVAKKVIVQIINYNLRVINQMIRYNVKNDNIINTTLEIIKENKCYIKKSKNSKAKKFQITLFQRSLCLYSIFVKIYYEVKKL